MKTTAVANYNIALWRQRWQRNTIKSFKSPSAATEPQLVHPKLQVVTSQCAKGENGSTSQNKANGNANAASNSKLSHNCNTCINSDKPASNHDHQPIKTWSKAMPAELSFSLRSTCNASSSSVNYKTNWNQENQPHPKRTSSLTWVWSQQNSSTSSTKPDPTN